MSLTAYTNCFVHLGTTTYHLCRAQDIKLAASHKGPGSSVRSGSKMPSRITAFPPSYSTSTFCCRMFKTRRNCAKRGHGWHWQTAPRQDNDIYNFLEGCPALTVPLNYLRLIPPDWDEKEQSKEQSSCPRTCGVSRLSLQSSCGSSTVNFTLIA